MFIRIQGVTCSFNFSKARVSWIAKVCHCWVTLVWSVLVTRCWASQRVLIKSFCGSKQTTEAGISIEPIIMQCWANICEVKNFAYHQMMDKFFSIIKKYVRTSWSLRFCIFVLIPLQKVVVGFTPGLVSMCSITASIVLQSLTELSNYTMSIRKSIFFKHYRTGFENMFPNGLIKKCYIKVTLRISKMIKCKKFLIASRGKQQKLSNILLKIQCMDIIRLQKCKFSYFVRLNSIENENLVKLMLWKKQ